MISIVVCNESADFNVSEEAFHGVATTAAFIILIIGAHSMSPSFTPHLKKNGASRAIHH
jgi:hypothetical protein